jgi:hypothetical protein
MPTEPEIGTVVGQVQTDSFCEGCGYNLHTQSVIKDDRLGILVTRCPECGRYAATGHTTTGSRLWLNRLATILLTAWVFFLLMLFGLFSLFLGMTAYGHVLSQTSPIGGQMMIAGQTQPTMTPYHYVWRDTPPAGSEAATEALQEEIILVGVATLLGFLSGASFAIFLWHCKGWPRLFCLLPALAGCAGAAVIWVGDSMSVTIRGGGVGQICLVWTLQMVAAWIGLATGRPIARAVIRILVPPKPRQHLSFLWTTDGKVLRA